MQSITISLPELRNVLREELESLFGILKTTKDPDMISRKEAARLLKIDLSTLHRRTQNGDLTSHKNGGNVYYMKSEIAQAFKSSKK